MEQKNKKRLLRFGGTLLSAALVFALCSVFINGQKDDGFSGKYSLTAFAETVSEISTENELNVTMSDIRYKISNDKRFMLLVTAFEADEVLADTANSYIIGYEINTQDTFDENGKKYYESIKLKTGETDSATYKAEAIFGETYSGYYLNVYELADYDNMKDYTLRSFIKQITPVGDSDYTVDKVCYSSLVTMHAMQYTAEKAATCTEDGNIEYWYCENCDKYYSDANGVTEITLEETVIAKADHTWSTGEQTPADDEVMKTVLSCSGCGATKEEIIYGQDVLVQLETNPPRDNAEYEWIYDGVYAAKGGMSMKITQTADGNIFIKPRTNVKDWSDYDYYEYWIYNPGMTNLKFYCNSTYQEAVAGKWTRIVWHIDTDMPKDADSSQVATDKSNISSVNIQVGGNAEGTVFYMSPIVGRTAEEVETVVLSNSDASVQNVQNNGSDDDNKKQSLYYDATKGCWAIKMIERNWGKIKFLTSSIESNYTYMQITLTAQTAQALVISSKSDYNCENNGSVTLTFPAGWTDWTINIKKNNADGSSNLLVNDIVYFGDIMGVAKVTENLATV